MSTAQVTVGYGERPLPAQGQAVAYTGTSAQSSALPTGTSLVRVTLSTAGFIEIGTNPTAVASTSVFMPAGAIEYFPARAGDKIAAIQSASNGTMYISAFG